MYTERWSRDRVWLALTVLLLSAGPVRSVGGEEGAGLPAAAILDQQRRAEVVNRLLETRLETLLPGLMREAGVDMWLVINREYAEDPVYLTLVPEPVFAARRTTMLMFFDRGEEQGVERRTISRYGLGELYEASWEGGEEDDQWSRLAELVRERDPRVIGVNTSNAWPVADGLTASLDRRLQRELGPDLASRLASAEDLVVRWLETRTREEAEIYPRAVALARGVIAEAFSSRAVTPGVTTTEDLAWHIRQRFADLDLPVWFMPYVNVQRPGTECLPETPFCGDSSVVIRPGDVLHTDVGICYLRLCTDTQEMGYVLRPGERLPPEGLRNALTLGNRWQNLLTERIAEGGSGNEILEATQEAAADAGILASVYTHPVGHFGHAPGPTIGMWDNQGPTPVRGDWPVYPMTAYAIEGNVKIAMPEWDGQWLQIKLEQSALFDGKEVRYLAGRQRDWHLVGPATEDEVGLD